jgi:hypothetical protein
MHREYVEEWYYTMSSIKCYFRNRHNHMKWLSGKVYDELIKAHEE